MVGGDGVSPYMVDTGAVAVERIWARKFRSLGDVDLDLGAITVVVGENGTGKTNLYRSLRLLVEAASGELSQAILAEGGCRLSPPGFRAVRIVGWG